ncbi:MAG TPA: GNAT family N-acetyltransferase [Candidatus Krumholzibacteria bacterium]|nr:GNAT family N-acetyltransferase [Candidatus Krumholzibacteria bacterium]
MAPTIRIAANADDQLKVMVVRGIVFVEEQQVDWAGEFDQYEAASIHVLGEEAGEPVATGRLRLLPDGWAKFERIAVRPRWRGRGLGRAMVIFLLEEAQRRGIGRFRLHAQTYLEDFYAGYGFRRQGEVFDECGIPHVLMTREDG